MIYNCLAISFIILLVGEVSYCQSIPPTVIEKPEIGRPMPAFGLQDVHYFKTTRVSLDDFHGKWLILNFWYRGCVSSIKSLSKLNALQNAFKEQAQFILIGVNDARSFGKGIEPLYERLREKLGLKLPSVYDSTLSQKWHITSFPHIIIIDPAGIVKAIINGYDMTEKKLADLFQGMPVEFHNKDIEPPLFDGDQTGSENLAYRSLLLHWNAEQPSVPDVFGQLGRSGVPGYRVSCVPLYRLYTLAYIGKAFWNLRRDPLSQSLYPYPVIEPRDSALFIYNYLTGKGIYNYELIIKDGSASKERIMHIMQTELKAIFNREAFIESRLMPVWKLVASPGAGEKLRAKEPSMLHVTNINGDGGAGGFSLRNITTNILLDLVRRYIDDHKTPFFNDTEINHRIDITIDALMTDRDQIKRALRENGLDLIMGEKQMEVLVIREPNTSDD